MTISPRRRTITTIEKALENKQSAAISDIIKIIQRLAANASNLSINELAALIERDSAMVEKVISAANTIGFKASVPPVLTISQAIHTIGYEKIRNLAIALIFAESTVENTNSYEQREVAALSVCSGMMAQNFLALNADSEDPELVFVCTSLRSFGKLLMSSFLIEDYRKAKTLAKEYDEDTAFENTFGITPLALACHMLQATNVPRKITQTFKLVPDEMLTRPARPDDKILLLANLCTKICELAFDENLSPEQFQTELAQHLELYDHCLPTSPETVMQALVELETEFSDFNKLMEIPARKSPGAIKLKSRIESRELPPTPVVRTVPITTETAERPPEPAAQTEHEQRSDAIAQKAINVLEQAIASEDGVEIQEIYQITIAAIKDCLHLENCLIFVPEEFDPSKLSARFGEGPLFRKIKNRPLLTIENRDIFSISMNRKEDILIEDITAGKTRSIIPNWITDNSETNSFVILPTVNNGNLIAIIFGSVAHGLPIKLQVNDIKHIKQIRRALVGFNSLAQ